LAKATQCLLYVFRRRYQSHFATDGFQIGARRDPRLIKQVLEEVLSGGTCDRNKG
jgi:hypothetical protein